LTNKTTKEFHAGYENFGGLIGLTSMEDRANDNIQDLFSDTESDIEQFEGFNARDIRPYAEIACKAPLFCPTPVPKAKRVHIESNDSSTGSLNDNESIAWKMNLLQEYLDVILQSLVLRFLKRLLIKKRLKRAQVVLNGRSLSQ